MLHENLNFSLGFLEVSIDSLFYMYKKPVNYAFIDSQNINLSIRRSGWILDFFRFRIYLKDKYHINKAFVFIGYIEGRNKLYTKLQEAGFICIFKKTLVHKDGITKGNCDAELVLHTMIEYPYYDKALIASGDGDFSCLVEYLIDKNKLEVLLIPNRSQFSALFKFDTTKPFLRFMNDLEDKLGIKKEKTP